MSSLFTDFSNVINHKTLIIAGLAIGSTVVCERYGLQGEFPFNFIALSVVFPIVFSIGGAYKRREKALDQYAQIKALARSLYFLCRDWHDASPRTEELSVMKTKLRNMLEEISNLLHLKRIDERAQETEIYQSFDALSGYLQTFRQKGLSTGELSRGSQFLSKIMAAFEKMKHIHQYWTPVSLRAYSKIFMVLLPVLYGPYFVAIAQDFSAGLQYIIPVLFSVLLVSLDNIQDHLENPFDRVGSDDIFLNIEKFHDSLV